MSKEEYDEYINYGVPGKFKSETSWYSIEEFVALRPKQYSYITENNNSSIKAKGISKESTKKYLNHKKFVDQVLMEDRSIFSCKMQNIQSKDFRMYSQYIWKKALINYKNKRYCLNSIYSLPFCHPWINKIEAGEMSNEEAINYLRGEDRYEIKSLSNTYNNNEQINNIAANENYKSEFQTIFFFKAEARIKY